MLMLLYIVGLGPMMRYKKTQVIHFYPVVDWSVTRVRREKTHKVKNIAERTKNRFIL